MVVFQVFSWDNFEHIGAPDRLLWDNSVVGDAPFQTAHGRTVKVSAKPLNDRRQVPLGQVLVGARGDWIGNLPGGIVALRVGSNAVAPDGGNPLVIGPTDERAFAIAMQIQAGLIAQPTSFTARCRTIWADDNNREHQEEFSWPATATAVLDGSAPTIGAFSQQACIKRVEIWATYDDGGAAMFAIGPVEFQMQAARAVAAAGRVANVRQRGA